MTDVNFPPLTYEQRDALKPGDTVYYLGGNGFYVDQYQPYKVESTTSKGVTVYSKNGLFNLGYGHLSLGPAPVVPEHTSTIATLFGVPLT